MQRNTGFLRRQGPILPAIEWLSDGSLPAQEPGKKATWRFGKAMKFLKSLNSFTARF